VVEFVIYHHYPLIQYFYCQSICGAVIKVVAICAFILLGALAVIGLIPIQGYHHAPLLNNFTKDGLFPGGFSGLFMTMLTVNFAFSGTELIAITAGETKHPEKA